MTAKGAIAAGHPETVRAAAIILDEGGNAFDAVLVAGPADDGPGPPVLYDFFTQTPKRRERGGDLDFHPITADFGTVTQEFHIGLASVATPGTVKGLLQVHGDLCTMPLARIIEPALARKGFRVNHLQAYLF